MSGPHEDWRNWHGQCNVYCDGNTHAEVSRFLVSSGRALDDAEIARYSRVSLREVFGVVYVDHTPAHEAPVVGPGQPIVVLHHDLSQPEERRVEYRQGGDPDTLAILVRFRVPGGREEG